MASSLTSSTASAYYPYGEERQATANERDKFATYYRDSASGLDYANQRYYSTQIARFTTVDPSQAADAATPQSWNRYAYALNDPITYNDPSGLRPPLYCNRTGEIPDEVGCAFWEMYLPRYRYWLGPGYPGGPMGWGGGEDPPPNKGGWKTSPTTAAKTGWQYLTSIWSDCLDSFSTDTRRFDAGVLQGLLTNDPSRGGITWLDTRYSTIAEQTVGSYAKNADRTPLKGFVGDANAMVIRATRNVVLGVNWYTDLSQTAQIASTIHEALRVLLNIGDADLKDWLGQFGFTATDQYGSGDITNWIEGGCQRKKEDE